MSFKHAAPRFFQRLHLNSDWRRASAYCCIHNTLPPRAHAWAIEILLDDEFLEAWKHGIVLLCPDGISQRFYLRIFTYSADYPEKWAINLPSKQNLQFICRILIVSIHNLGKCPCPRCLIPLSQVHCLEMTRDMSQRLTMAHIDNVEQQGKVFTARRLIYEKYSLVNSSAVEALLQDASWVPTSVCLTFY